MTRRYPAYRESGIDWLGEVPQHWNVGPLKRRYTVTLGKMLQPEPKSEEDTFAQYLRAANIQWGMVDVSDMNSMWFSPADRKALTLKSGDLLVSEGGDVGRSAIWRDELEECYFQNSVNRVRPQENASTAYLFYWMATIKAKGYVDVLCNKSTIAHFTAEKVAAVPVPMPPLPEQTAIAAFLDRETAKIDALVAEQRRLIDLLREKRQAVISHAVTKGLNPNAALKPSGIDWLGDVPEGWEVGPLKRVTLERCDGPFGSGLKSEHYVEAGMRVVRLQNIKADGFSDHDAAFIDLDYASSELSRHEVLAGDVLIAGLGDERNLVGRACVAPVGIEPAMVKADCFRFRLDTSRAVSAFVALQLNTSAAFDAGTKATGTTRSRIPLSQMAERAIALPPLAEQHEIAGHVQRVSDGFDTLTATAETAIALLQERRAALISAAVTGKIDVRHLVQKEDEAA